MRVCGIHAIIARSPDLFKSVMMTPAPLPPGVMRSEANERQKGLIMGDAGHAECLEEVVLKCLVNKNRSG